LVFNGKVLLGNPHYRYHDYRFTTHTSYMHVGTLSLLHISQIHSCRFTMWALTAEMTFDHVRLCGPLHKSFVQHTWLALLSVPTCGYSVGPFYMHHRHFFVVMWLVCLILCPLPLFIFMCCILKKERALCSKTAFYLILRLMLEVMVFQIL
jgi:hypothetical protein